MKRSLRDSVLTASAAMFAIVSIAAQGQKTAQQGASQTAQPTPQSNPSQIYQQLQQQQQSVPTLRTDARLVVLDVVVVDAQGHPVTGLKATDFTLLEDGQSQTFKHFEEHLPVDATAAVKSFATLHQKLPPDTFTNYTPVPESNAMTIILIDALNTNVAAQAYARSQLINYLKTAPPGDPIAIFQLGDEGMQLVQGFSSDPQVLLQAAESSKRNTVRQTISGPNGMILRQQKLQAGIQGLGRYLAAFPGRKNLIWFTGTVPYYRWGGGIGDPFPDTNSFIDEFQSTTDILTLSRVVVYPVDARGLQVDPQYGGGVSGIPSNASASAFGTRQFLEHSPLDQVADATGGRAFYNTNGLKQAIADVVDIGSHYYTLTYTPSNTLWNGSYRRLQVQLARKGLHLEYRPGYYARGQRFVRPQQRAAIRSATSTGRPLTFAAAAGTNSPAKPLMLATMALGALAPTQIVFAAKVSADPLVHKEPLKVKVDPSGEDPWKHGYRQYTVRFIVRGADLQLTQEPDQSAYHARAEFAIVLFDQRGVDVNSRIGTTVIDVDASSYQQLLHDGMATDITLSVPVKGNYFLRLGVRDLGNDRVGALEIPVDQIVLPKK